MPDERLFVKWQHIVIVLGSLVVVLYAWTGTTGFWVVHADFQSICA